MMEGTHFSATLYFHNNTGNRPYSISGFVSPRDAYQGAINYFLNTIPKISN